MTTPCAPREPALAGFSPSRPRRSPDHPVRCREHVGGHHHHSPNPRRGSHPRGVVSRRPSQWYRCRSAARKRPPGLRFGVGYRCLLKLGARYYDPTLARFTQPDPAHTCGGYAYAGDDPANNTDPTGRSCVAAGLAGGAVGFVVGAVAASPADIPTVGLASVAVGIDVGINTGLATYISCELAGLLSSWGL